MDIFRKIKDLFRRSKQEFAFDSIVDSLRRHNVQLDVDEDGQRCYFTNGLNYVLSSDRHNPSYFRIVAPCVYDINRNNELNVLQCMNTVNMTYKVLKFIANEDAVHLEVSGYLCTPRDTDTVLNRCFTITEDACRMLMEETEKSAPANTTRVVGFR